MPLFERVSYCISLSLVEDTRIEIARILDRNGAAGVSLDHATHVISNTIEFEGCDKIGKDVACVTPFWVERSMQLGQLQDTRYFSADREMIFSGIVATSADIPPSDKEVISAGITDRGGAWREGLTRDVTHLFVTNTRSDKYQTAMHFRHTASIIILLPQWFDHCWSIQMRLPTDVFEFPDPSYARNDYDLAAYRAQMRIKKHSVDNTLLITGMDKQAMFRTMQMDNLSSPAPTARDVWQGRSILLSSSLELDPHRQELVEDRIRRNGGLVVVPKDEEESVLVERADVFITRYRAGSAYNKALAKAKTIGTLAWLFFVERTGVVSCPRDRLLHYPVRSRPIEAFAAHEITVTNYQGDAREYIKKLIEIMGAKFTPTMSGRNTIVIAAYKSGDKTAKAEEWSIPVVTHKWLEDCFVEWRNLTPAQKQYIDYAPGVNYGTVIGERGIGRVGLEEDHELPPEKPMLVSTKDAPGWRGLRETKKMEVNDDGLAGTATSAREALEVAEVEDVLHLEGDLDPSCSPTKVGPPRVINKVPEKKIGITEVPAAQPQVKSNPKLSHPVPAAGDDNKKIPPPLTKKPAPTTSDAPAMEDIATVELHQRDENREVAMWKESTPVRVITPAVKARPEATPISNKIFVPDLPSDEESVVEVPPPGPIKRITKPLQQSRAEAESTSGTIQVTTKPRPKRIPTSNESAVQSVREKGKGPLRVHDQKGAVNGMSQIIQVDSESEGALPPKTKSKLKATTLEMINLDSEDEDRNDVGEAPQVKSKLSRRTYWSKTKLKSKANVSSSESESDNEVQPPPPQQTQGFSKALTPADKGIAKAPLQPSPHRIVTVEIPDPRSLLLSKPRPKMPAVRTSPIKATAKPLERTSSIRVAAFEAPVSSSKRDRLSRRRDPSPRSPTPSPQRPLRHPPMGDRSRAVAPKVEAPKNPSIPPKSSSPPPVQRTPSQRYAAAAAMQKLRDEVMPDVVNYENERKRDVKVGPARRRKSSQFDTGDEEGEDEDSDIGARARKKRRVVKNEAISDKGKGKGKSAGRPGSEAQSNRFVTHVKNTKRPSPSDDEEPGSSTRTGQPGSRKKVRVEKSDIDQGSGDEMTPGRSSWDPKKIRVLTTKVSVPEEIERGLSNMGIKFTQEPRECTHLVAGSFARTEKFLCALPNAPFVLNRDWLIACAKYKRVVAESAYALQDPDAEYKHNFKLKSALERSRELKRSKRKLLQGHFFYITPGVSLDFKLLKKVLLAHGAECKQGTPTMRNISETRHVVSCLKDEGLWRPLARQGIPIYSHELILMAALAQYADWDGVNMRLPMN